MADDRRKDDPKTPPRRDDVKDKSKREDPDKKPRNGELDQGLDDSFPASDPPAPTRPTGEQ